MLKVITHAYRYKEKRVRFHVLNVQISTRMHLGHHRVDREFMKNLWHRFQALIRHCQKFHSGHALSITSESIKQFQLVNCWYRGIRNAFMARLLYSVVIGLAELVASITVYRKQEDNHWIIKFHWTTKELNTPVPQIF